MLGVYDYTVVLTYVSVLISMGGMLFSLNGCPKMAVVCLAVSGFCDMFDGKIARTKRTVQKWRNVLVFRLIRWQTSSALAWLRH